MTETTYAATVRRDGRWWLVYLPELDTAGQARTLAEAEDVAREVVGLYLDVEADAVAAAASMRRQAIKTLHDQGITQADTARALGISPQRVSQLIHN